VGARGGRGGMREGEEGGTREGEEGARAAQGRSTSPRARCSSVSVMARPARSKESDARRASEEAFREGMMQTRIGGESEVLPTCVTCVLG
jgi:hypothetical protein